MGLIHRLRHRLESMGLAKAADLTLPEELSFSAEVPLASARAPLWKINVQIVSEPQVDGERVRLRAHIQTNFASVLKPALTSPIASRDALEHNTTGRALTLAARTGALAQRALANPTLRRLAEPLLKHDFNTWVEMQTSTASLNDGAHALLPQSDKLTALGITPSRRSDAPVMESWSGQAGSGFAQVSMMQMDKRHLPPSLAALLDGKPFHMTATVINTVEEK